MNKKLSRTNRNYIIMGLCAILVIMGVGYAAFSSQLKISGTSNIASNFLVKITGIEVSSQSGGAADKPEVTTYNDTSATFGTTLQFPGDSITYDITIENQGTIDAILKTISKTDASNSAIIFETSGVNEGDPLNVGETATMQVKVTYNTAVTSQPDDLDSTLKVDLTYEQSESVVTPPEPSGMTPEDLKELVVTHGDGLYADEYEEGKYTYKGANPNNYITFNNETWRIISIDFNGLIKIMRNESIGNVRYDEGYDNSWETSDIKSYLNDTYLPTITVNKDIIVSHTWSIGGVSVVYSDLDLAEQIVGENGIQSQPVNLGMITVSEYLRANPNKEQCENMNINMTNSEICLTTNWMYDILQKKSVASDVEKTWTITPLQETDEDAWFIYGDNGTFGTENVGWGGFAVFPSLYLSSDITLTGEGTSSNPYTIAN